MPAPAHHVLGCDLISRLYTVGDGDLDFWDFGLGVADEILGTDTDGITRRYGALLVDSLAPGRVLVAIRGTKGAPEWESDFDALLIACPFAPGAKVHAGFNGIFVTFRLKSGLTVSQAVEKYTHRIVMGHSLGGPLATYVAALAAADELVCYASPKPGDPGLGAWIRSRVPVRTFYANPKDIVPHAPLTITNLPPPFVNFDYEPVDYATPLNPDSVVPPVPHTWADSHAILNYRRLIAALP